MEAIRFKNDCLLCRGNVSKDIFRSGYYNSDCISRENIWGKATILHHEANRPENLFARCAEIDMCGKCTARNAARKNQPAFKPLSAYNHSNFFACI